MQLRKPTVVWLLAAVLSAQAQVQAQWTVQVAAYTNEAEAQRELTRLEPHRLGHYAERSGGYIRVRAGCFGDVDAATQLAERLSSLGFSTSLAPLTAGARPRRCVARNIGFVTPERWSLHEQNAQGAVFQVQLGDARGFISYTQAGWTLSPAYESLTETSLVTGAPDARAFFERDGAVFHNETSPLYLALGQLLWQNSDTALILETNKVSAYRVHASQNALQNTLENP